MSELIENEPVLANDKLELYIKKVGRFYNIGQIILKENNTKRICIDAIQFLVKDDPISFLNLKLVQKENGIQKLILSSEEKEIQIEIVIRGDISANLLEIGAVSPSNLIKKFQVRYLINFDGKNNLDYVALSGNLYKNITINERIILKANKIGTFSGIWSVSSKETTFSVLTVRKTNLKYYKFIRNPKNTEIFIELLIKKGEKNTIFLLLGNRDYLEPIKLKFLRLEPMIPLKYSADYKNKVIKAFNTLKDHFLFQTKNGFIPANFVYFPVTKRDKYQKSPMCSYANCFSLGYIYGASACYIWTKDASVRRDLITFLNPIIKGAQIKEGPCKGAFFDTYYNKTRRWTTGRVQMREGGFSDWIPYDSGEKIGKTFSGFSLKEIINQIRKFIRLKGIPESIKFLFWSNKQDKMVAPYMKEKISKLVIYPPYAGQYAYFLLQTLIESKENGNFLERKMEQKVNNALNLTAEFLLATQRKNDIWDHELYIDGEVFWDKETLACIFPATFLIWWGKETNDKTIQERGFLALKKCNFLQDQKEYYGMYYETDLSINQADLVTAYACIKCYCKLYEILGKEEYLERARRAAWHVISFMWSNVKDKKKKNITGGLLVTTYKSLGFPVIGGSELCQCFEVFCEISKHDRQFLVFTRALLGFCLNYLVREGPSSLGIYEIIFGYFDNWSSSFSDDFASYASGPFIRGLFLFEKLVNLDRIS